MRCVNTSAAWTSFSSNALNEDGPLRLDAEFHRRAHRDAARGETTFHVTRAAPVERVLVDACVERTGVPLLALAGRNHVDMSVQDQRGGLVARAPSRHEILPLDRELVELVPERADHFFDGVWIHGVPMWTSICGKGIPMPAAPSASFTARIVACLTADNSLDGAQTRTSHSTEDPPSPASTT